ncbi:hypothetical protein [Burkholderia sp. Ac-20365]|uniref:hypothetical protein n=1 Tax=Burkholderia sp. Ac-20365 TaxID=2703897 RepID=UPI00197C4468|nr:hypothetical protein [Burkholderia sp. Ac-20365]MBN3760943.1 hypothetical protein [Burkholderia sp. Ac-20365]
MQIPVPETGNRSFERVLKAIELDEFIGQAQISKFVAPRTRTSEGIDGQPVYPPGSLQQRDLAIVRTLFVHPDFIARVIINNPVFDSTEARVYQFQNQTSNGNFVYGIVVTDSARNLVDFCLDASRQQQRRNVLKPLIRAICTPESLQLHGRVH